MPITLFKLFVRLHLEYNNVAYDQANNEISVKIKSMKC